MPSVSSGCRRTPLATTSTSYGQHGAVVEQHLVALDPDRLDLVLVEDDAVAQLAPARPHDLVDVREPEGDEEQAGLVDVPVVAVDDVDLGLVGVEAAAQPVGGHRAAGAAAEDHDLLPRHDRSFARARGGAIGGSAEPAADNYAVE